MTITDIEQYTDEGIDNDFNTPTGSTLTGPKGLFQPSSGVTRVRIVPSDAIGFQAYPLTDSTAAAKQPLTQLANKRPAGVASKLAIRVVPIAAATGRIYLTTNPDPGEYLTAGGVLYLSNALYLCDAATAGTFELVTAERIYAVCLNTAVGNGALITVSSEIFFAE